MWIRVRVIIALSFVIQFSFYCLKMSCFSSVFSTFSVSFSLPSIIPEIRFNKISVGGLNEHVHQRLIRQVKITHFTKLTNTIFSLYFLFHLNSSFKQLFNYLFFKMFIFPHLVLVFG